MDEANKKLTVGETLAMAVEKAHEADDRLLGIAVHLLVLEADGTEMRIHNFINGRMPSLQIAAHHMAGFESTLYRGMDEMQGSIEKLAQVAKLTAEAVK